MPKKVVLTGACGYVAQRMIGELRERYDLVCLDVFGKTRDGTAVPDVRIADLADTNRDAYRRHFEGADAVLHCAFIPAQGMDAGNRHRLTPGSVQGQNHQEEDYHGSLQPRRTRWQAPPPISEYGADR